MSEQVQARSRSGHLLDPGPGRLVRLSHARVYYTCVSVLAFSAPLQVSLFEKSSVHPATFALAEASALVRCYTQSRCNAVLFLPSQSTCNAGVGQTPLPIRLKGAVCNGAGSLDCSIVAHSRNKRMQVLRAKQAGASSIRVGVPDLGAFGPQVHPSRRQPSGDRRVVLGSSPSASALRQPPRGSRVHPLGVSPQAVAAWFSGPPPWRQSSGNCRVVLGSTPIGVSPQAIAAWFSGPPPRRQLSDDAHEQPRRT